MSLDIVKVNHNVDNLKKYNWKLSFIDDIYNGSRGYITLHDPIAEIGRIEKLRHYHREKKIEFNDRVIKEYGVLMKILTYDDWLSGVWYPYYWLMRDDYMINNTYPMDLFYKYSAKLKKEESLKRKLKKLSKIGLPFEGTTKEIVSRHSSLARSKRRIYEIVYHTDFKYFITLTFNTKFDNSRDSMFYTFECLRKYLHKIKVGYKRAGDDQFFKYLIIPEFHADKKNVHFHMLATENIKDILFENDYSNLDLGGWDYGFTNVRKIGDKDKALSNVKLSSYISKYIIKQIDTNWPRRYFSNVKSFKRTKKIITGNEFEKIYNDNVLYVSNIDETIYMTYYENLTKE